MNLLTLMKLLPPLLSSPAIVPTPLRPPSQIAFPLPTKPPTPVSAFFRNVQTRLRIISKLSSFFSTAFMKTSVYAINTYICVTGALNMFHGRI